MSLDLEHVLNTIDALRELIVGVTEEPLWRFTVVAKDENDNDVGPAEFVAEADLIPTIKRMLDADISASPRVSRERETLRVATHVEVHEGDVG